MKKYFSQYGQDHYLDQSIFKMMEKGFFIDIGANDGETYSNTLFFEKERQWSGVCFEPIPSTFEKLKKARTCMCVNAAISKKDGVEKFIMVEGYAEMLSGLKNEYSREHFERLESEINVFGGEKKEIDVDTININDFCARNKISKIDYLSIDTEGSEFSILKTINFKNIFVGVISIEANYSIDKIKILLFMLFSFRFRYKVKIGSDLIFVNKKYKNA